MRRFQVRQVVAGLCARGHSANQSWRPRRTNSDDGPHCSVAALRVIGLAIVVGIVLATALESSADDAPGEASSVGSSSAGLGDSTSMERSSAMSGSIPESVGEAGFLGSMPPRPFMHRVVVEATGIEPTTS